MKLPIIRHLVESKQFDVDFLEEANEVLISITEARGLKDEELDVIGELISNISGAQEVMEEVENGVPVKDALNHFMKRVVGSIDK